MNGNPETSIQDAAAAAPEEMLPDMSTPVEQERDSGGFLERIFSAKTGPGEIDNYMADPMNITEDKGGAQVARGLTGLFNVSDGGLAWVDLLVGGIRIFLATMRRRREAAAQIHGADGHVSA